MVSLSSCLPSLICLALYYGPANAFTVGDIAPTTRPSSTSAAFAVSIKSYIHDGWNLTYRHKPASPGFENENPVLLVHPVGIGLSSWFWERLLQEWNGPAVYAPNLIGCGIEEGGQSWNPDERGLSFPLGWVKGCETLMETVQPSSPFPFVGSSKPFTVVSQGGLAPVAVMLASRNPDRVKTLALASPPVWKEMVTEVPEKELEFNYNFLRSPILGEAAFAVLELRLAVQIFSNLLLFSESCDKTWLDNAQQECKHKEARPPVWAFNAGFCQHRSFEEELCGLSQETLIVAGNDDKKDRTEYVENMKNCKLVQLPGLNVLPWEYPSQFADTLIGFTRS